ncbi:DUF2917 domain-containing protein [Cupriavidus sp. 2TAF22]|uniref:DUF2917 domain-containing protein n=1 Tax=unclassified Cupriavidus TaxID=2640874 RepID=UPI003F910746
MRATTTTQSVNPSATPAAAQGLWLLGPAALRIPLGSGSYLICTQGMAWLTQQSAALDAARRDTVLACGERFVAAEETVVFVSGFRGRPACIAVRDPA